MISKKKLSGISVVITVVVAAVGGVVFLWNSQAIQDKRIAEVSTNVAVVAMTLDEAQEATDRILDRLDMTLASHGQLLSATRETLVAVQTTQVAIRMDVTRLTTAVDALTNALRDKRELAERRTAEQGVP
jgi:uncharacterized coiled-coil protein SlyX